MAVNCNDVPSAIVGSVGETSTDCSVAAVTVIVVEPLMPLNVAVISALPMFTAVATPWFGATFVIVATLMLFDNHVACVVRSCVVPSVNTPVAMNGTCVPFAALGFVGVT